MYELYQISISHLSKEINALGWEGAIAKYPVVKAYMDATAGEKFQEAFESEEYKKVAEIKAESLDEAFAVGNIGPEENIKCFAPMHSVSVGDILVDVVTDEIFAVAPYGFEKIDGSAYA